MSCMYDYNKGVTYLPLRSNGHSLSGYDKTCFFIEKKDTVSNFLPKSLCHRVEVCSLKVTILASINTFFATNDENQL